jgi:glycosyltransferase involved in cell wall biosynthesis
MRPKSNGRPAKLLLAMEPLLGGTLRHLRMVLRALPPGEFRVHLAVSHRRSAEACELYRQWRRAGYTVHDLPMRREMHPLQDLTALAALLRLCHAERFDLVHTHSSKAGFLGRLAGHATGAATLHTPHVFPFNRWPGDCRFLALEGIAARWTSRFLVLSAHQADQVQRYGLATPARVTRLPNAISPTDHPAMDRAEARRALALPPDVPLVLGVGRLCRQKGFDVLVEAARLLRQSADPAQVVILGDGPLETSLRRRIDAAGLQDAVSLPGHVDDVAPWYAACDMVAMPSRYEGMPYVLLESKVASRPIVVARVSGLEEFVRHGRDGYLVPPENPRALANVLRGLAGRQVELAALGRRARQSLRPEWHQRHFEAELLRIYRRAVER